jgi:preprotein translocase subunit SecF
MKFFSFYRNRKWFFLISGLLMAIGIVGVIVNGVELDIQFTGGAILKYTYQGELDAEEVAEATSQLLDRATSAQLTTDLNTGERRVVLNLAGQYGMSSDEQAQFLEALNAKFPDAQFVTAESSLVQPFFGRRFLQRSIFAVVLALVLILVYEWITFRKIGGLLAGISALAALIHDLLIVFFTCVIAGIPIGDSFVAVALSIIGYSINDTIVVFDRIRENHRLYPSETAEVVADLSVRQSMMRSINTNAAVTISVFLIYIMAARANLDSVISFALPMAIGSISGCYSTLCLCGPLWVMMQKFKQKRAKPANA